VSVLEVIQRSTEFLGKRGVESPRLQVELVLAHVLNMPRMNVYLNFERELSEPELEQAREMIKRRGAREPLQHILGSASFCGLEIAVSPHVLVPRPETEILAERAWGFLNPSAKETPESDALDFGTGSGCIAIAVAAHSPSARIVALDCSGEALELARSNAARHSLQGRIEFVRSDGFQDLPANRQFDLIVSNPPYIATAEIETLEPEVRDHDPRAALDGGADGLDCFRRLAREAPGFLKKGGVLLLEFGDGQAAAVEAIFARGGWTVDGIERDHTGLERFLRAQRG
jgi:release factor glutamine methyltransferase